MDKYLSIGTLAEMTETSESYWRKAVARRLLPAVKIGGGRAVRVRLEDAQQFLRQHLRQHVRSTRDGAPR